MIKTKEEKYLMIHKYYNSYLNINKVISFSRLISFNVVGKEAYPFIYVLSVLLSFSNRTEKLR